MWSKVFPLLKLSDRMPKTTRLWLLLAKIPHGRVGEDPFFQFTMPVARSFKYNWILIKKDVVRKDIRKGWMYLIYFLLFQLSNTKTTMDMYELKQMNPKFGLIWIWQHDTMRMWLTLAKAYTQTSTFLSLHCAKETSRIATTYNWLLLLKLYVLKRIHGMRYKIYLKCFQPIQLLNQWNRWIQIFFNTPQFGRANIRATEYPCIHKKTIKKYLGFN